MTHSPEIGRLPERWPQGAAQRCQDEKKDWDKENERASTGHGLFLLNCIHRRSHRIAVEGALPRPNGHQLARTTAWRLSRRCAVAFVLSSRTARPVINTRRDGRVNRPIRETNGEWRRCCVTEKGVAAVDRALSIVSALGDARRPLTLSETAAATRLYKSTTLRLIASLEARTLRQSGPRRSVSPWLRPSTGSLTRTSAALYSRTKLRRCCNASSMRRLKASVSSCGEGNERLSLPRRSSARSCAITLTLACSVRSASAPPDACSNYSKTVPRKRTAISSRHFRS